MIQRTRLTMAAIALCASMACASPVLAACFGNHTDDFEDGVIDATRYVTQVGSGTVTETGGAISIVVPAGTIAGGNIQTLPTRMLCGDFDVQIDFALSGFDPPAAANRARVASLIITDGVSNALIERYTQQLGFCNPGTQNYKAWITNSDNCSAAAWAATSDMSGKFRATRVGTLLTLSYWDGSAWVALKSGSYSTDDVQVIPASYCPGNGAAPGTTHEARFDNLIVTSGGDTLPAVNPIGMLACGAILCGLGASVVRARKATL